MTSATATTETSPAQPAPTLAHPARTRVLAVIGAAIAALAVWAVAVPLLGAHLVVRFGGGAPQTIGASYILGASVLGSLAGWGLLALLERRTSGARRLWTLVAVVALLLSLSLPLSAGTTLTARATLALMHLAVAAVLIPTLRRTSRLPAAGTWGT